MAFKMPKNKAFEMTQKKHLKRPYFCIFNAKIGVFNAKNGVKVI